VVRNVWNDNVAFVFKGKLFKKNGLLTVEDESTMIFANTRNQSPNSTASHSRKLTFPMLYGTETCDKVEALSDAWLVYADSGAVNSWWIAN
jgi:hypothetical protein